MADRRSFADESFRRELADALARTGELTVVVCRAQAAGHKDWFLVCHGADLDTVLARIPATGRSGYSDRIEAYATGEFPYRGRATDAELRDRAIEILRRTGEVVLAEQAEGDPELRDVEATNQASDVADWLAEQRGGRILVGPHPFRHDADPAADVHVAWNAGAGGGIRPGAY